MYTEQYMLWWVQMSVKDFERKAFEERKKQDIKIVFNI